MDINNTDKSTSREHDSILNHIINCANAALQNEDAFPKAMLGLAAELRSVFGSEYCTIGIVDGDFAEECMISYEKFEDEEQSKQQELFLKSVNRANVNEDEFIVCRALKSEDTDIFLHQEETGNVINNEYYQSILTSGHVKNSYVIPLRDKEKKTFGFIQFINTKKEIDYEQDISPYSDALLGLVKIIINNHKNEQELIKKENRLKDARFYQEMQDKRDNVDDLLNSIMKYFSEQFNAAVISFRIPILNADEQDPLFYLRSVFVHPSIGESKCKELINRYRLERLEKRKSEISVVDKLKCEYRDKILESKSDTDFKKYDLDLQNNTLIIPIFRDFDDKCIHPNRLKSKYCKEDEHRDCKYRFKRLYGIFRLRISNLDLSNGSRFTFASIIEVKERLTYLSKQIALLLNSIVDKHENESLKIFQEELKNSSFIKIQDFDKQCVEIIKKSFHAKVCSIYRYDNQTTKLSLSATTAETIQFLINRMYLYFQTPKIQNSCFFSTKEKNNILTKAYTGHRSLCVFNILDSHIHQSTFIERIINPNNRESAIAVPMLKKDGTCTGVVLLLGKEEHKHSISTAFWEHDIKHIEFIVDILTRISESDTERLTFLSQLSHELLAPVTELVYDNDYIANIADRNSDSITKQQLISKLRENLDRNMLFKYIITDTEFIYSSGGQSVDYNIVKQDYPQDILLEAIRLMEKEAHAAKGLSIITYIAKMPPLYFDKDRMMQVFLNLLKNAIRYSDDLSTIRISYNKGNSGFHEIRFENDGIGVQQEEKENIFKLFHRGEEAKKKTERGTGMGLYIVRGIMRAHGGDCFVSKLREPTIFVITLPIQK